ncbi:M23 family metallopeptidase [Patescibacteria group bacterium]|nr:M23 family metallopeptidase [Patescibacteria group bacterium]
MKGTSTTGQSPEDPYGKREQGHIKKVLGFLSKTLIFLMFLGWTFSAPPASAGLFSFLEGLFKTSEVAQEKPVYNSQTLALLENTNTPGMEAGGIGGGDITIINQNALLPDSGPLGTIADIRTQKPKQDQISVYVVRNGDNLSQIAEMFGVSINTIIWTNDLKRGSLITPGQTLIILPISGVQYTVQKGDTLASIAKKLKGDIDEIIQFNGLTENQQLAEGDTVVVPNGAYETPAISSSNSNSITPVRGYNNVSYSGYYMRPIDGGRRSQGLHGYNAVDLADSCGTPVMASASGDVVIARNYGWNAGYGNYVVITHSNGTQTLYAHLNSVIVSAGWHVVKGQVIGYIGTTGRSTGCHVHFEIRGARNPF